MAIQDPAHFGLPDKYTIIKQKLDLINAGFVKHDEKTFDEADIEELFLIKEYLLAKNQVEELKKNARRSYC